MDAFPATPVAVVIAEADARTASETAVMAEISTDTPSSTPSRASTIRNTGPAIARAAVSASPASASAVSAGAATEPATSMVLEWLAVSVDGW